MSQLRDDLQAREDARRRALWSLRAPGRTEEAQPTLMTIWRLDRDQPIGSATLWSTEKLRASVQVHDNQGQLVVLPVEIPEPWRTRFECASLGATRGAGGRYADDWESFLEDWIKEEELTEDLVEHAIERAIAQAGKAAVAGSEAALDALGIDPDELQDWVNERIEIGSWPEGDLAKAFQEWKTKRPMHGA